MPKDIDTSEVIAISTERGILEADMAKGMYGFFDKPPMLNMIRDLAYFANEQILVQFQTSGSETQTKYEGAMTGAGGNLAVLGGFGDHTMEHLETAMGNKEQWSASDCGDLIRLYGGMVESKGLHKVGEIAPSRDVERDARRIGGNLNWSGTRHRGRGDYLPTLGAAHIAAAHKSQLANRRNPDGFAGFAKVFLLENSTVKRIDSVFGLPEGCDISGTTADSIFFMEHIFEFLEGYVDCIPSWTGKKKLLPIVQLLPLAAMVSQGHHTVVECALTLTLNKYMEYCIGFYSTLMPLKFLKSKSTVASALATVLTSAENDPRNKHVLCFQDNGVLKGWLFEPHMTHDIQKFKRFATVGQGMLTQYTGMKSIPDRRDVFSAWMGCR